MSHITHPGYLIFLPNDEYLSLAKLQTTIMVYYPQQCESFVPLT